MWSMLTTFTAHQKRVFVAIALSYILMWGPGIISATFVPPEAAHHDVSPGVAGIVVSVYSLIQILASPYIGILIGRFGPKKAMVFGFLACALGSCLTGILQHLQGSWLFISVCFLAMLILGIGVTTSGMSCFTYAAMLFPDKMNTIMGAIEAFIGFGEVTALPLGGALTDVAGYQAPFLFFGGLIILAVPILFWLLPVDDMKAAKVDRKNLPGVDERRVSVTKTEPDDNAAKQNQQQDVKKAIKLRPWNLVIIGPSFLMVIVILTTGVSWMFIATTFDLHVESLDLTAAGVGSLYAVSPAIQIFACPAWGYFADRVKVSNRYIIVVVGLLLTGLSFGLLGPLPFLGIPNSIVSNTVALITVTIWLSAAIVPASELSLAYCLQAGYEDNIETYATVSGWFSMFYAAGSAIGSGSGGYLVEAIEYPYAAGVFGFNCIFWGIVILVIFGLKLRCSTPRVS